ncbi:MAG: hypothetical protein V2I25_15730, partial [Woeseiaceae bacterium]|nr:hypothetical protein [Woeseiaceae bacterium]
MRRTIGFGLAAFVAAGAVANAPASAQEGSQGAAGALLEEITVTARKREELAQSVPVAITAYSGEQLEA